MSAARAPGTDHRFAAPLLDMARFLSVVSGELVRQEAELAELRGAYTDLLTDAEFLYRMVISSITTNGFLTAREEAACRRMEARIRPATEERG